MTIATGIINLKRAVTGLMFSLLPFISFSQGMYGFEGGVGYCTSYKGYITPAAEGYYLHKITQHFFAGGSVSFQRYSFLRDMHQDAGSIVFGDIISVRQKSSFLFLCPKIDYAIGYRKIWHVHIAGGPGFFVGGTQYYNQYQPLWTSGGIPYGADTAANNTTFNIPDIIFRGSIGLSERIPTLGYWNIMLSQEFTFMPGNLGKNGPALNTGYFALTVGVMHKYPQVWVEY